MRLFKKAVKDDLVDAPAENKELTLLKKVVKHKAFTPGVAVLILLILLMVFKNVLGSQKSELGYYDTMVSIFSNELGSFSYSFSVETGDKGTLIKENTAPTVEEVLPDSDAETEADSSAKQSKEFVDWDKYAEVKMDNWQHPVYRVTISGTTMSVDPLLTNFSVVVATPAYNNKFTEVTVRDDSYYVDVESMYNWLSNSSDAYLIDLAKEIPHGSKWLEIPASEFAIPSRYAESGDEQELSEAHSLVTLYRRFLTTLKTASGSISSSLGETGIEKRKEVVYLNLAGDSGVSLVNAVKGISTRSGDFYQSVISSAASSGLYDETQQKQALREKDNVITAMSDLSMVLQTCDAKSLGLVASGQVRQYVNGFGNNQIEGTLGVQFSSATTDYILKFSGIRSGDQTDIVVPDGSKTEENADMYLKAFYKLVDYFNFTPIKTDVKLSINPDTISEGVLEKFIKLVNDTGSAGYWVTRSNVDDFIAKYKDFKDTDIENENDLKNKVLVEDLVKALDKVVPRGSEVATPVVDTLPVTPNEPLQYPDLVCTVDNTDYRISYDPDISNHDLFVLTCDVVNKGEEDLTLNCREFVGHDLLNSTYPANNETLIRNYDNLFDMSLLDGEITIPPSGWKQVKLYFIIPETVGHVDLFYGDIQLGAVIQF